MRATLVVVPARCWPVLEGCAWLVAPRKGRVIVERLWVNVNRLSNLREVQPECRNSILPARDRWIVSQYAVHCSSEPTSQPVTLMECCHLLAERHLVVPARVVHIINVVRSCHVARLFDEVLAGLREVGLLVAVQRRVVQEDCMRSWQACVKLGCTLQC